MKPVPLAGHLNYVSSSDLVLASFEGSIMYSVSFTETAIPECIVMGSVIQTHQNSINIEIGIILANTTACADGEMIMNRRMIYLSPGRIFYTVR